MKLFVIVLFFVVASVFAVPVEQTGETESANDLFDVNVDASDDDLSNFSELVRDKRQYGGK